MKTLKCIGCKSHVVVSDGTIGYCATCKIELQEDKRLDKELGLTKDKPIKIVKLKKKLNSLKKQSKTKLKKSKKKKQ